MAKMLPMLGLVTAGLVALLVIVATGVVAYLLPAVLALAIGVVLILRRETPTIVAGAVVVLVGLTALVLVPGSFTFKGGDSIGADSAENTLSWAVGAGAGILAVMAVTYAFWSGVRPAWAAFVGIGGGVLALIVLAIGHEAIGEYADARSYLVAFGALAAALPSFFLVRDDDVVHERDEASPA